MAADEGDRAPLGRKSGGPRLTKMSHDTQRHHRYRLWWSGRSARLLCGGVTAFNLARWRDNIIVRKFEITDASFERSPGQDGDVFTGRLIDERQGGPITIGYGRYAPGQSIDATLEVDDVMVVLEGRLSVTTGAGLLTAGPGDIVHMPKGEVVTIRSHEAGAVTAYVTYPHWRETTTAA